MTEGYNEDAGEIAEPAAKVTTHPAEVRRKYQTLNPIDRGFFDEFGFFKDEFLSADPKIQEETLAEFPELKKRLGL
jgi:hypothetical protein